MKAADQMSAPQQQALVNIANGLSSSHGLRGRSEMGGHTRTMMALYRGGMVLANGSLTDKGRDVVQSLRMKTPNG